MTYCKIVIPKPCDNHSQVTDFATRQFNKYVGGSTSYNTEGSWVSKSDDGKTVMMYEPSVTIESYTNENVEYCQSFMKVMGEMVKEMTNELSVMTVVNHSATFY